MQPLLIALFDALFQKFFSKQNLRPIFTFRVIEFPVTYFVNLPFFLILLIRVRANIKQKQLFLQHNMPVTILQ